MNEERLQAYLNLIQALLSCPSGEEPEILNTNQELIDPELVQVMEQVAAMIRQQGDENSAEFLQNLAVQLSTLFSDASATDYRSFLVEVLQATSDSQGNPQVVYPILQRNQNLLDNNFARLLQDRATATFSQANPDELAAIAGLILNLSTHIQEFPLGSRANNIEIAITGYEIALEVYTRKAFPEQWAMTQNNLGNAYSDRIRGDRAENIEGAIACYQAAIEVYTRKAFPEQWATTQNNLGNAYSDRIRGDQAENLEGAIEAYKEALKVYTPTAFPINCLRTGRNLGNIAFAEKMWESAIIGYDAAIAAVEQSREWVTSEQRKREILEDALDVYEKMVQACINAGQLDKALLTVERSKSRYLVELLAAADIYPKGAPEELKQQLNALRRRIFAIQQTLDELGMDGAHRGTEAEENLVETRFLASENIAQQRQALQDSQQQLNQLLNQIKQFDPEFTFTQRVEPINLADIRTLIDPNTAILEWHIGTESFQTFIITHDHLDVVEFNTEDLQKLQTWAEEYLNDYRQPTWQDALNARLHTLGEILRLSEVVAKIPQCQQLILIPHRYLHLFPLHALPLNCHSEESEESPRCFTPLPSQHDTENFQPCLLDCFQGGVRYAPSCQLLHRMTNRKVGRMSALQESPPLFAIQNPTQDLPYTDVEVDIIKRAFDPNTHILKKAEATKTALNHPENLEILRRSHYAHFSCHGAFNSEFPLRSALILAGALSDIPLPPLTREENQEENSRYVTLRDGRRADTGEGLTLQEIFATLDLPQCRLVTLSACETGWTDSTKLTDEYIGLPSGFLYAGSATVVSSLWCVDDFATAFLMVKFYEILGSHSQCSVATALKEAQLWLRTVSNDNFLIWLRSLKLSENKIQDIGLRLDLYDPQQPFSKPQYWAAFCAIGQ